MTAWEVAAQTPDPELPMVTLGDLGILRDVHTEGARVVATITPTYSGCPAMREIGADLRRRLERAGFGDVEIRTRLAPPWTSDWITDGGRRKLAAAGIAPPAAQSRIAPPAAQRPRRVALNLGATRTAVACPRCDSADTERTAQFGSTACKALYRCRDCREPFEYVKEI